MQIVESPGLDDWRTHIVKRQLCSNQIFNFESSLGWRGDVLVIRLHTCTPHSQISFFRLHLLSAMLLVNWCHCTLYQMHRVPAICFQFFLQDSSSAEDISIVDRTGADRGDLCSGRSQFSPCRPCFALM